MREARVTPCFASDRHLGLKAQLNADNTSSRQQQHKKALVIPSSSGGLPARKSVG